MRIGVVVEETGATHALEVPADIDLLDFKAFVAVEVGVPPEVIAIARDGQLLTDNKRTLVAYGVSENDLLSVRIAATNTESRSRSNAPQPQGMLNIDFGSIKIPTAGASSSRSSGAGPSRSQAGQEDPESIRNMFLTIPGQKAILAQRNPDLAAVLNDPAKFREVYDRQMRELRERQEARIKLAQSDLIDPSVQQRIFEDIQQRNLDAELQQALEENPEFYAKVAMLYVDVTVGAHAVKAFIDSGAQMTIMSLKCAQRCGLERLIDKRFSGIARGVGEQKIVGRIHKYELIVGGVVFETSFQVLQDQDIDMLIGLDMLRRHQACIDLKRNVLAFGNGHEVPFLPESELPEYARLNSADPYSQPQSPHAQA